MLRTAAEIYTLSLHDALPISANRSRRSEHSRPVAPCPRFPRSEEHTSELQSLRHLVCRLLLQKKNRLESVITVIDDVQGEATLDAHAEAVKQAAVADRLVLTKLDLLTGRQGEDAFYSLIGRPRAPTLFPYTTPSR